MSRWLVGALLAVAVLASACASSGTAGPASTAPTGPSSKPAPVSTSADAVQAYLDAVNELCDQLLPKIVRVTNGGSVDVPVKQFLASWPAHHRLEQWFDAQLAKIPVPSAAKDKAAALAAYIRFANRLDAARVSAAGKGEAAYRTEIKAEANAENDPAVRARTAAGFSQSCDAR